LDEQRAVNRFVRHLHRGGSVRASEPGGNLLRGPVPLEPSLDDAAQPAVLREATRFRAPGAVPRPGIGLLRAIRGAAAVAADLPANGRRRAAELLRQGAEGLTRGKPAGNLFAVRALQAPRRSAPHQGRVAAGTVHEFADGRVRDAKGLREGALHLATLAPTPDLCSLRVDQSLLHHDRAPPIMLRRPIEYTSEPGNLEPRKTNSTASTAGEAPRWARSGLVLASRLRDRGDRSKAEEFASIFAADGLGDRRSHHMPWVTCTMPWSRTTDDP
jgi:hypothetical protein